MIRNLSAEYNQRLCKFAATECERHSVVVEWYTKTAGTTTTANTRYVIGVSLLLDARTRQSILGNPLSNLNKCKKP